MNNTLFSSFLALSMALSVSAADQQLELAATIQIPVLDTRGDVYKTEGANDPLIYDSTIGHKKAIMLYA
ncbi:MAG: hypothetical protein QGH41_14105, partial [Roseibacillus sp.]|nr:hypothetical protein [Roseibacillus sp.]